MTDREFGSSEREQFISRGQVGKFYRLDSTEPSVTKIIEESLQTV